MTEHEIEDLALKVADDWRARKATYESDWDILEERVRHAITYAVESERASCLGLIAALAVEWREEALIVEAETAEDICKRLIETSHDHPTTR